MTGTELDDILADNGSQETTEQTTEQTSSVARDDHGRFAPKVEAQPEVVTAQAETVEAEHTEGNIPPAALAASRQKAREKEQEAETLRREMAELRGQIQVLSQRPATPPQPKPETPPLEPWDPGYDEYVRAPIVEQLQKQAERFSMRMAVKEYGKETVESAYSALGQAMQAGDPSARAEYQRIKASDDPYEDIVQWHRRQETLRTVGDDPNAWLEAEIEKRLADPVHQGKFLDRIQATAASTVNRSNPVTKLPPSLTRLPSGGNAAAEADMSDAGIFANALR